jgi:hypothetical protein
MILAVASALSVAGAITAATVLSGTAASAHTTFSSANSTAPAQARLGVVIQQGAASRVAVSPGSAISPASSGEPAVTTVSEFSEPSGSPEEIAQQMLASFGWSGQFSCLEPLWAHESGWDVTAENPVTGAYGIPQALPGSKMASAGPDWQTDAATQIRWGLEYIQSTYASPCAAWSHEEADGWY